MTLSLNTSHASKQALRRQLREARRALSREAQLAAEHQLARQLYQHPLMWKHQVIAAYLPNDGEISPLVFMEKAFAAGKTLCLPVLHRLQPQTLGFVPWHPGMPMQPNRFGIPEPRHQLQDLIPLQRLGCLLMPLVGFDQAGNRLGMGGGFYDRSLARLHGSSRMPRCIGLAHRCQEVDSLPVEPWDIPLDEIIAC